MLDAANKADMDFWYRLTSWFINPGDFTFTSYQIPRVDKSWCKLHQQSIIVHCTCAKVKQRMIFLTPMFFSRIIICQNIEVTYSITQDNNLQKQKSRTHFNWWFNLGLLLTSRYIGLGTVHSLGTAKKRYSTCIHVTFSRNENSFSDKIPTLY